MAKTDDTLDRNPGFLVHDVARLMRRTFDQRVREVGLTRAQWFVLAHLYREDGVTQSDLADELDMEPAPLGRLIDRLEENGWLRRAPDAKDRRAKRVFLTDRILPRLAELRAAAESVYADAFAGASEPAFNAFIDMLRLAKSNLDALCSSDQPKKPESVASLASRRRSPKRGGAR